MSAPFGKIFGAEANAASGEDAAAKSEASAKPPAASQASKTEATPRSGADAASTTTQYETVLGAGSTIEGKVVCKGPTRIAGNVQGEVVADGLVAVDEGAVVAADLNVRAAAIGGRLTGNVNAAERVTLAPTALIEGDIRTPSLSIAEGAQIMGRIDVKPGAAEKTSAAAAPSQERAGTAASFSSARPLRLDEDD